MSKIVTFAIILILSFFQTYCSQQKDIQTKNDAENKTYSSSQDYEIKSPDEIDFKDENVTQEIPEEINELKELADSVNQKFIPQDNKNLKLELPKWAKDIGLTLPEGMEFVRELSNVDKFDKKAKTIDAINFVFKGDLDKSLKEAEKIAKKANIPISEDFLMAQKEQEKQKKLLKAQGQDIQFPELKGIIYSNASADPNKLKSLKYIVTIIVEENGNLVINALNNQQAQQYYK